MNVFLTKQVSRIINDIDEPFKTNILEKTQKLKDDKARIGKMAGKPDRWKVREGNYRIVLIKNETTNTYYVIDIGHRREIYKRL